jgi:hypothetical protein
MSGRVQDSCPIHAIRRSTNAIRVTPSWLSTLVKVSPRFAALIALSTFAVNVSASCAYGRGRQADGIDGDEFDLVLCFRLHA